MVWKAYIGYNWVADSTVDMQLLTCRVDSASARGGACRWWSLVFHACGRVPAVHTCGEGKAGLGGHWGGRPVLGVIWPTVMRRFESDVENAAQDHAEVQIGAMTWYQGNPSMPDAAAAERGLVRDHGPQDWTSSPPRGVLSPRIAGQDFSECRRPEVGAGQRRDAVSVHLATLYHHLPLSIPTAHICTTYPYHLPSSLPPTPIPTFLPPLPISRPGLLVCNHCERVLTACE